MSNFDKNYWAQTSAGLSYNSVVPKNYKYNGNGKSQTLATIIAADFFLEAYTDLAPGSIVEFTSTDELGGTCVVLTVSETSVTVRNITSSDAGVGTIVAVGQGDSLASTTFENTFSFPGVLPTDQAFAIFRSKGQVPAEILSCIAQANEVFVTYDINPQTDHVLAFLVVRANA